MRTPWRSTSSRSGMRVKSHLRTPVRCQATSTTGAAVPPARRARRRSSSSSRPSATCLPLASTTRRFRRKCGDTSKRSSIAVVMDSPARSLRKRAANSTNEAPAVAPATAWPARNGVASSVSQAVTQAWATSGAGTSCRRNTFGSVRIHSVTNSKRQPGTAPTTSPTAMRVTKGCGTVTVAPSSIRSGSNR